MSGALNLALTEAEVVEHCRTHEISISTIEALPAGGVRLVCSSNDGAARVHAKFARKIMTGDVQRTNWRRALPQWQARTAIRH